MLNTPRAPGTAAGRAILTSEFLCPTAFYLGPEGSRCHCFHLKQRKAISSRKHFTIWIQVQFFYQSIARHSLLQPHVQHTSIATVALQNFLLLTKAHNFLVQAEAFLVSVRLKRFSGSAAEISGSHCMEVTDAAVSADAANFASVIKHGSLKTAIPHTNYDMRDVVLLVGHRLAFFKDSSTSPVFSSNTYRVVRCCRLEQDTRMVTVQTVTLSVRWRRLPPKWTENEERWILQVSYERLIHHDHPLRHMCHCAMFDQTLLATTLFSTRITPWSQVSWTFCFPHTHGLGMCMINGQQCQIARFVSFFPTDHAPFRSGSCFQTEVPQFAVYLAERLHGFAFVLRGIFIGICRWGCITHNLLRLPVVCFGDLATLTQWITLITLIVQGHRQLFCCGESGVIRKGSDCSALVNLIDELWRTTFSATVNKSQS